jgi:hypothetical protein
MTSIKTALLSAAASVLILCAAQAQAPGDATPDSPSAGAVGGATGGPAMNGGPGSLGGSNAGDGPSAVGPAGDAASGRSLTQGEASPDAGSDGARSPDSRSGETKAGKASNENGDSAKQAGTGNKAKTDDNKATTGSVSEGEGKSGKAAADSASDRDAKSGQGKSARVDREQVDKARTYFRQNKPSVKSVDRTEISVSIGATLPSGIALYDAPDVIVVSGACPIKYFVWGDDVVLVDSCTREVVEIIVGVV